jgi:5'-methylthioadenosine phosphorylase
MVKPEIAFIMRSDEMIDEFGLKRITVDTSYGPVDRCYVGNVYGTDIMVIYGRFNGQKVPSDMINYQQNIEAVKNMGINKLVGTFVVGGIDPIRREGTTYVLGDMVGMGNYHIQVNQQYGFHNVEMYIPFCESLTSQLEYAADKMPFKVIKNAIYVCFHGWPRIETKAELDFYNNMGWDVVGQTCDPESTIARLMGICYSAIAVQIDDPMHRENDIKQLNKNTKVNSNALSIKEYRKNTTAIILQLLKEYKNMECNKCCNLKRKNNSFKEFPEMFYE